MELTKIGPMGTDAGGSISRQTDLLREQLGTALRIVDELVEMPVARQSDQPVTEREVRTLLRLRRNRDRFFQDDLFADPAWDILLELYAAELGQLRMSVGSLCVGAAVPPTTALRWINELERRGMIVRRSDPTDGRRQFLMLSRDATDAMSSYFRTVPKGGPLI